MKGLVTHRLKIQWLDEQIQEIWEKTRNWEERGGKGKGQRKALFISHISEFYLISPIQ